MPAPTPKIVQLARHQMCCTLLATAEDLRREPKLYNDDPLPGMLDYASSGVTIESAAQHLRESIPNGQKGRTEAAFAALREAVALQEEWLRAKGFDV